MSSNKKYWRSDFELNGDSKVIESLGKDDLQKTCPLLDFTKTKMNLIRAILREEIF